MNRDDFSILNNNLIYFDSSATSLKPKCVVDKINEYYNSYSANIHRGEYSISFKADEAYNTTRNSVAKFINADESEIVFTSGTTASLNMVVNDYLVNILNSGDEIITTYQEHASLILPMLSLTKKGVVIKYVEDLNNISDYITDNTKVIAISHITNVLGLERDIKEITEIAHKNNILVLCDGAQSIPHIKVDVTDLDVDFYAFSAHKILGPTGVGVLYAKKELLDNFIPSVLGGGMNENFDIDGNVTLKRPPISLEAGTPNIEGVIAFNEAINYINSIGIDKITKYVTELTDYLMEKLSNIPHIKLYSDSDHGIVSFNVDGIFAQDVAYYLDKYNICVRAGNHCAKLLHNVIGVHNTVRISLYFYNTKEEIDKLVLLLSDKNKIVSEMI